MTEDPGSVYDLEHLRCLAFNLSMATTGREVELHRAYGGDVFTAVCLTADAVLRLHPQSVHSGDPRRQVWNAFSVAVLARSLMETAVSLHYFALDPASDGEATFRILVADIHAICMQLHMSGLYQAERETAALGRHAVRSAETDRKMAAINAGRTRLRSELQHSRRRLRDNAFYQALSDRQRGKWFTEAGDLKGECRRTGFLWGHVERARRAGLTRSVYEAEYSHLSAYAHAGPHAVNQVSGFSTEAPESSGLLSLLETSIRSCTGFLSLAILFFLQLFPDCETQITAELRELLDSCSCYAVGIQASERDQLRGTDADAPPGREEIE